MSSWLAHLLWVRDFILVILVQGFMLLQCGFFYLRLRYRASRNRSELPAPPSEELLGPITVVMPAFNEAEHLESSLRNLEAAALEPANLDVVISDSASTDETLAIARRLAKSRNLRMNLLAVTAGGGGRGGAICAGLEASELAREPAAECRRGAIVLFVHADTRLPHGFDLLLRGAFAKPGVLCTAFSFRTDRSAITSKEPAGLALMERSVNMRSGLYELPFGDQALAVTRQSLALAGGFPELPLLEEYELVQRFRRIGAEGAGAIITLPEPALCSPRRWLARPIWKVNWINQMTMIRYNHFGATPEDIFKFYYGRDAPAPRQRRLQQSQSAAREVALAALGLQEEDDLVKSFQQRARGRT